VAHTIIDLARQPYCQLIVLEAHGRSGVVRALNGSVAEGVARHSNVPVLLAPPTASV
jgi:nucleotide-binding universal stress UspA family protein